MTTVGCKLFNVDTMIEKYLYILKVNAKSHKVNDMEKIMQ